MDSLHLLLPADEVNLNDDMLFRIKTFPFLSS